MKRTALVLQQDDGLKSWFLNIQLNDLSKVIKPLWNNSVGWVKEEPLSSWSNSKHPLTIIHCVVFDFWKSEVLKNNRIWKISSSSSFLPSSVATGSTVGRKYPDKCTLNISSQKYMGAVSCYHSLLLLSDPNHTCGEAPVKPPTATTLTSETRGSLVYRPPTFFQGSKGPEKVYFGQVSELPSHFLLLILRRRPTSVL